MKFHRYFQFSLALPYLIAIAALGLVELFGYKVAPSLVFFAIYPVVIAGIPYAVFVITVLLWSKSKSNEKLKNAMWLLPFAFLPLLAIAPFIHGNNYDINVYLETLMATSVVGILYGYGYIVIAYLGWFIFRAIRHD